MGDAGAGRARSRRTTPRSPVGPRDHCGEPVGGLCKKAANLCVTWGIEWIIASAVRGFMAVTWGNRIHNLCTKRKL